MDYVSENSCFPFIKLQRKVKQLFSDKSAQECNKLIIVVANAILKYRRTKIENYLQRKNKFLKVFLRQNKNISS